MVFLFSLFMPEDAAKNWADYRAKVDWCKIDVSVEGEKTEHTLHLFIFAPHRLCSAALCVLQELLRKPNNKNNFPLS